MTRLYSAANGQTALFRNAKTGATDNHANRGMSLERALNEMHELYAAVGVAKVDKQYVPSLPVKDGKWAKVVGRSTVDYTGELAGGRHVAFDAKDCEDGRIALSRLADHQREYLEGVDALGGLAFVLVRFHRRSVCMIPIRAWCAAVRARLAAGRVSGDGWPGDGQWDGWTPTGKASFSENEMPQAWKVDGYDWAKSQKAKGREAKSGER